MFPIPDSLAKQPQSILKDINNLEIERGDNAIGNRQLKALWKLMLAGSNYTSRSTPATINRLANDWQNLNLPELDFKDFNKSSSTIFDENKLFSTFANSVNSTEPATPVKSNLQTENQDSVTDFSKVIVFGDSISDMGNIYAETQFLQPFKSLFGLDDLEVIPPSPPYFDGRYSNGKIYAELIAEKLGFNLIPTSSVTTFLPSPPFPRVNAPVTFTATETGIQPEVSFYLNGITRRDVSLNFAHGGANTGDIGIGEFGAFIPGISRQVDAFIADHRGRRIDPDALFMYWGGANDFRFLQPGNDRAVVRDAISNISGSLRDLIKAGAKNILLFNQPDLGLTPIGRSGLEDGGDSAAMTRRSKQFNARLERLRDNLTGQYQGAGVEIEVVDVFDIFTDNINATLRGDPDANFTNVLEPLLGAPPCDPQESCEYLFWDFVHPSATAHRILADFAMTSLDGFSTENSAASAMLSPGGSLTQAA
jgi:phospholipase/lecithinase/hemolysin